MAIAEANRLAEVGEYYFSKKLKEINEIEKRGVNVINLGIGNPDLPPSESTISTLVSSAINPENHGYQSYRSSSDLRQAISEFYNKTYSVDLNPETEVLPLIGSKEGIMHISMAFLNPGDEVLVPNPGYPAYTSASKILDVAVKYYDLKEENNWQIDIAELKSKDLSKVKIMWINYPHMPTGVLPSDGMFKELVSLTKENNFLLCNDNPYSLVLDENPESLLSVDGAKEVSLELNSLSKSHNMAGWRLGWVAGNNNYIESVLKVKSNIDSGIFLPIQHAAVEALKNPPEWHSERNKILSGRREAVFELLNSLNCAYDKNQVGMFVWAKLPESIVNAEEFIDELLNKANVFITPGFIFGSNGMRYVRVSLCSSRQKINEAIQRVKSKLKMKEKV
jgi:aspartate/methionine/tyrosine aminotransferase